MSTDEQHPPPDSDRQQILLQGNDSNNTYAVYSRHAEVIVSQNSSQPRINASNKIKVNKIVNYEWEQRYVELGI